MKLDIHLHFQGNCRQALDFYGNIFGVSPEGLVTYGDAPADPSQPLPEGYAENILHSALEIAGIRVMLSDGFPGWQGIAGNQVTLSLNFNNTAQAETMFKALQQGGEVHMPLTKTFFSEAYGMLTDQFGVLWHIAVMAS